MMSLKEFYNSVDQTKQISFYNNQNELILNQNNVCDCDEIAEEFGDTTDFSYDEYGNYMDIILSI